MSYMMVSGKIYHCTECENCVIINYEGGAQQTFIGDMEIWRQSALSDRYESLLSKLKRLICGSYEHYLHEEAICESCYKKKEFPDRAIEEFNALFSSLGSISSIISELVEFINARKKVIIAGYCSSLEFKKVREIDEAAFDEAFGDLKKPFRKVVNSFITSAAPSIRSFFLNLIMLDHEVQLAYATATSRVSEHFSAALSMSHLCGKPYYSFTNIYSPENLHYLLMTDQSVRSPETVSDKPIYFYYQCEFNKANFEKILGRVDRQFIIEQVRKDEDKWVAAVKAKLLEFCKNGELKAR